MSRFLNWPSILILVLTIVCFGMLIASITLTMPSADFRRLERAFEEKDVDTLHRLLINGRAVDTKWYAIYYLGEIREKRSIPVIAQMLSYDLPWYDRQWLDMLDGGPYTKPVDVRIAAYKALYKYGDQIVAEMKKLVSSKPGYGQMYSAALLVKLGESRYVEVLRRYEGDKRFEDDMRYLRHDLSIQL